MNAGRRGRVRRLVAAISAVATGLLVAPAAPAVDPAAGALAAPGGQALHSEPSGTPGGGVEDPLATRDYGQLVVDMMLASGFVPKAASGNLCTYTTVVVP